MNKEIIKGIREYYQLPSFVTDEVIEKELKGSLGEAYVSLNIALDQLKKSFINEYRKIKLKVRSLFN